MSGLKTAGAILALIGGALFLVMVLLGIGEFFLGPPTINVIIRWIIALVVGVLGLVGGILGLASKKKTGGTLALVAGIIGCTIGIIYFFLPSPIPMLAIHQYSLIAGFFDLIHIQIQGFIGMSIEAILILVGGILILASEEDV